MFRMMRLRIVMNVAKLLGVPVQVHQRWFDTPEQRREREDWERQSLLSGSQGARAEGFGGF